MSLLVPTVIPPPFDLGRPARLVGFAVPSLTVQELQSAFCTTIQQLADKDELFLPASPRLLGLIETTFSRCLFHVPEILRDRDPLSLSIELFSDYYLTKFRLIFTSSVLSQLSEEISREVARVDVVIAVWAIATKTLWRGDFAQEVTRYILNCPRV